MTARLLTAAALVATLFALPACDSGESEIDGPLAEAQANLGQWTFIDVEGSVCRDGSATGIGVRLQEGADDLVIYLEGGGACFNGATCTTNPSTFGEAQFTSLIGLVGNGGLFNTTSDNPVGAYNMVYVPYCTGDLHGGSFPNNTLVDAQFGTTLGPQQFVGHQNVERAVNLLADGLPTPGKVVLTGASAGGFGALINFDEVASTFTQSDLFLVDDSGPLFFADNVFSPQLAAQVTGLYNLSAAIPGGASLFAPDALPGVYNYYATTYPDATFGLASSLGDNTIQAFFGFGQAPGDPITDDEYAAGLRDVRSQLDARWGTYFVEGDAHTILLVPSRYTGSSAGVAFDDWFAGILAGAPTNVDPGVTTRGPLAAR
ncbi:pectin acetylesterase-family hydrolase [Rubrivirga sp. IMCC43871]|uniref:pectin acetylesterase-family hydrolase n=1 Tax=Rubrivirga sp. IMCC43871 TaxID=3391575 RepID=UPI0039900B90